MIILFFYWLPLIVINAIVLDFYITGFFKDVIDKICEKNLNEEEAKHKIFLFQAVIFCIILFSIIPILNIILLLKLMT